MSIVLFMLTIAIELFLTLYVAKVFYDLGLRRVKVFENVSFKKMLLISLCVALVFFIIFYQEFLVLIQVTVENESMFLGISKYLSR